MASKSREQLEKWLKEIRIHDSNVLDIGGAQLPVAPRLGNADNCAFTILDLPEPHELKTQPHIIVDLNEEQIIPQKYRFQYDVAFCLEVSEYWWNPVDALRNINQFLKEGADLFISFHFIYPVHNPIAQDALRYTEFGMKKILHETGFAIRDIKWRTPDNKDILYAFHAAERMRPSKDYLGHEAVGFLVSARKTDHKF